MRVLSDQQMSLVLGEHAAGFLEACGRLNWDDSIGYPGAEPRACAYQAAYNDPDPHRFTARSLAFDSYYYRAMTPESLMRLLDTGGL